MKVKELFESPTNNIIFRIVISCQIKNSDFDIIRHDLTEIYKSSITISNDTKKQQIICELNFIDDTSYNALKKHEQIVLGKIAQFQNRVKALVIASKIICQGIPDKVIDWDLIVFRLSGSDSNVSNVHKLISNRCNILVIEGIEHIKKGLLSLVKCTPKDKLNLYNTPWMRTEFIPWLDIVEKYQPTNDILSAQEELIDAGLKDAK